MIDRRGDMIENTNMEHNLNGLKGKKILVTGGAGFIGSHIVDALAGENRVTVLDNLYAGHLENLEKSIKRITFVKDDILNQEVLNKLVGEAEYVFHLAANVGNLKSIEDPYFDLDVNARGTLNVLEACRKSKIKRLVCTSSAAVYGDAKYIPIDEKHPLNPESPYAVSKLAEEKYCFAYHKIHGVPATALRYFNVYGPRQGGSAYANVISIFANKVKEGKPLTIYGDGKQTRDFVFVEDVVQANILAATQPGAVGEYFNIGTGKQYTINQLIDIFKRITGKDFQVNCADFRPGEIIYSRAAIKKAQKLLGYKPETELEAGLRLTWQASQ
jgi:UDP-glucose 4-epimerase